MNLQYCNKIIWHMKTKISHFISGTKVQKELSEDIMLWPQGFYITNGYKRMISLKIEVF